MLGGGAGEIAAPGHAAPLDWHSAPDSGEGGGGRGEGRGEGGGGRGEGREEGEQEDRRGEGEGGRGSISSRCTIFCRVFLLVVYVHVPV